MIGRLVKLFRQNQQGATAIEFALVALPLFMTIFFIFECALQYFVGTSLDLAVQKAARQVRTGQVREQAITQDAFKKNICQQMSDLFGCPSKLLLSVDVVANIANTSSLNPIDASGSLKVSETFNTGRTGDFLLVQAFLPWPSFTGLFSLASPKTNANEYVLRSTTLFRNEPF